MRRSSDAEQFVALVPSPITQVTAVPTMVVLPVLATLKSVVVAVPAVVEAMTAIRRICAENNVACGHPHVSEKKAEKVLGEGYKFVA